VVPRLVEKVYDKIYNTGSSAGGLKSKIFFWALNLITKKKSVSKPSGFRKLLPTSWYLKMERRFRW
jgi:long-chain acyl-CoA synthetase